MRSLNMKLILAFLAVSVIGTALLAWLAGQRTAVEFSDYMIDQSREGLAIQLAEFYQARGDWIDVELVFPRGPARMPGAAHGRGWEGMPGSVSVGFGPGDHLSLTDPAGRVIVAGAGCTADMLVPQSQLSQGIPIRVDGKLAGVLLTSRSAFVVGATGQKFLDRINQTLLVATVSATGVAVLLGVLLARSLTRPLRELTAATRAVAEGNLELQVPVRSRDELGALAESFNRMSSQLGRSRDLRQQMTADIAHELRTPLSLILGHAEALSEGVLPPTEDALNVIHDEAQRLNRLVEDLRTLSLSEAGELLLARRLVSARELLERTVTVHTPQAQRKSISLQVNVAPELSKVYVDPDRIAQVLDNLLNNALRHTPAGGPISLSARGSAEGVQIAVEDSGPGIPDEEISSLFERFYGAGKSQRRHEGGSGLGLAIAKSIVEAHGGRIWAESGPDEGATFVIELPTGE